MSAIDRFCVRLEKIGVEVLLHGNYPWVYLYSVNGVRVQGKFMANHGFTAFIGSSEGYKWSDRAKVFSKIRDTLEGSKGDTSSKL